jgi:hypothetical protein
VRILVVLVSLERYLFFLLLSLYLVVIMDDSEFIDNNSNSFVNINKFDLDNNRANIKELNNNNRDLIILLSNIESTPLDTINKEDKGPVFGLILKKTRRGTRILFIR